MSDNDLNYNAHQKNSLKVIIITMGLSEILEPIVARYNVIGIIECAPRTVNTKESSIFYKILKYFYNRAKNETKSLYSYAESQSIPYYYMNKGSNQALENWVKSQNPEVIIVYSMSQLLKKNIFSIPRYGTINLHPSLLPAYRGPNPDFWMYYNTEKQGGVTVHFIDEGEDTGDIIYQEAYDIPLGIKFPHINDLAIGKIGVNLLLKALENIKNLPRTAQPKESPTPRARNIKEDEHKTIIDWENWHIEKIWHILRGTELWLNAIDKPKGIYKTQRWCIEEFEKCNTSSFEVSKIYKENGRYLLTCSDGKIFLSLKFDFKKFILSILG